MKKFFKDLFKDKEYLISIGIFLVGQAFLYWFIKLFQSNPIYISYYLDDKIPFIGQFVYIYNLFYPFCFIAFYFIYRKDKERYYKSLIAAVIGIITCDIIYLFMPTIMYRPVIPNTDPLTNFIIKVTFFFDNPPLNCFPSIHCLFCFQLVYGFLFSKCNTKTKIFNICFSLLIILSTLLVKQHYIFDVLSALVICIIANLLTELFNLYKYFKRKKLVK